jgi:hypothetical protein
MPWSSREEREIFPPLPDVCSGAAYASAEAVDAVRTLLVEKIKPDLIQQDPKGGNTLYFSQELQDTVTTGMEEKFPDPWSKIQAWIAVRFAAENDARKQTQAPGNTSVLDGLCASGGGADEVCATIRADGAGNAAEDAEMPAASSCQSASFSSEEGAGHDRNAYKPLHEPFYAKIVSSATGPDPGPTSVFDHILSIII